MRAKHVLNSVFACRKLHVQISRYMRKSGLELLPPNVKISMFTSDLNKTFSVWYLFEPLNKERPKSVDPFQGDRFLENNFPGYSSRILWAPFKSSPLIKSDTNISKKEYFPLDVQD